MDTDELGSKYGDIEAYDYLTGKKYVTSPDDVTARFKLKSSGAPDHMMKMWVKGSPG